MKISQKRLKEIILEELKKEIEEGVGGPAPAPRSWPAIPPAGRTTRASVRQRALNQYKQGTRRVTADIAGLSGTSDIAAADTAQKIKDAVANPGPQADSTIVRLLTQALNLLSAKETTPPEEKGQLELDFPPPTTKEKKGE